MHSTGANASDFAGTAPIIVYYHWLRCDRTGAGCTPIDGATAPTRYLYPEDVGHTLRVEVTATNLGGQAVVTSAPSAVVAALRPLAQGPPRLSGDAREGSTFTVTAPTYLGTQPITVSYQWFRCDGSGNGCLPISGATASTHGIVGADAAHRLGATVTARNAGGSITLYSPLSAPVVPQPPIVSTAASVSGTAADASALTAFAAFSGSGTIVVSYTWQRCPSNGTPCAGIPGATSRTYALVTPDVGSRIRVVVTGRNGGGSVSSTSPMTAAVAATVPRAAAPLTISGSRVVGAMLTASLNASGFIGTRPIVSMYQWSRCTGGRDSDPCTAIPGRTGQSYTATTDDLGAYLQVAVTALNAAGSTIVSARVPIAPAPPRVLDLPAISGAARIGSVVTASAGSCNMEPHRFMRRRVPSRSANVYLTAGHRTLQEAAEDQPSHQQAPGKVEGIIQSRGPRGIRPNFSAIRSFPLRQTDGALEHPEGFDVWQQLGPGSHE